MQFTHEHVIEILAEITGMASDTITPQTKLADLEMDSLLIAEFVTQLAQRHGVNLAEAMVPARTTTVTDVVTAVRGRHAEMAAAR